MKLDFVPLDKLSVSKLNMRYGKKPDVSDILPTIRARGIIQPLVVRPNCGLDAYEILAGARRFRAASIVAEETGEAEPLPCAILEDGDDAAAIEASMIENMARLDPDEVTQWESFVKLVKQGRKPDEIGVTFGLPEQTVKRILALGNLLPRIRDLYRAEKIDAGTVRQLTMATKNQQKAWLALYDDDGEDAYVPTGHQLKAWLFGGAAISVKVALFDLDSYPGHIVGNLFEEDRFFADADQFWAAQNAAVEAKRQEYIDAGWSDAIVVGPNDRFNYWEHERTPKRKGGRVYLAVSPRGEVNIHEGYLTAKEARRIASGAAPDAPKPKRPEITSAMQTYIDLHRHAAVRADLTNSPSVALRLMIAHAIGGSFLWTVKPDPRTARGEAVAESVETAAAEAAFDERRRAVLDVLGFDAETPTVTGGNGDEWGVAGVFARLLELPDPALFDVIAIVMGETLASGSAVVEALGLHLGTDMARWWQADPAFFDLIRDKEVLTRIVAEVAGEGVASANAGEKTKTMKAIVRDCLDGAGGRAKVEGWVPRWMRFAPSAYTARGGVGTVKAHAKIAGIGADDDPTAPTGAALAVLPGPQPDAEPVPLAA